ncbi:MAG: hypothetical protein WCD46_09420, partial [Desulfobacterales bacterium]
MQDSTQPFQEAVAIGVVPENIAPFDSPTYDVMQGPGRVDSGLSRHTVPLSQINLKRNAEFQPRPPRPVPRVPIETFFSDQKSRGFNIDKSHLSCPQRLTRLMYASCLAYLWI